MNYCTYCEYSTPYLHNLKRHEKNKHSNLKAPSNTLLQPKVVYSSTEIPQHKTSYQLQSGSGVLHTTQQYDPRAKPQIQYNEVKHKGQGPQTSANYSVTQKPEDTDNETDTETVSEADTENISDVEEHDIYEVINDIHLAFNHFNTATNITFNIYPKPPTYHQDIIKISSGYQM